MEDVCIVVTGLPGSGKSTIARKIAKHLDLHLLDKDDYLEKLFEKKGTGDSNWRQVLSRESDYLFQRDAAESRAVVLVSHWRPIGKSSNSGTPTEWIVEQFTNVIELYCICPAEEATNRFINRKRHPGHLDEQKNPSEILEWMIDYQQHLPLSLGELERVDTSSDRPEDRIIDRLESVFASMHNK